MQKKKPKVKKKMHHMTTKDLVDAKAKEMAGVPKTIIAAESGFGYSTIIHNLEKFEYTIMQNPEMYKSVMTRLGELKETLLKNSEAIVLIADGVVAKKIASEDTSARDAAVIGEIYSKRLGKLSGMDEFGGSPEQNKEIAVKNLNLIFNRFEIKDAKPKNGSTIEGRIVENAGRSGADQTDIKENL